MRQIWQGGLLVGLRILALVGLGEGRAGAPGLLYKVGLGAAKENTSRPKLPQPKTLATPSRPPPLAPNPRVKTLGRLTSTSSPPCL